MRLTSVEIEGVGRFGTASRLTGLGAGVNILSAGNEAGKSTFFRAIRACLFERHTTRNDTIRNLSTSGLSLPVTVTLAFEHHGSSYKITKSFLKSPQASLHRDGREIARGRDADESVWEILGLSHGNGRTLDDAAFGILWVGQGKSFDLPQPSDAAASTLNAAIQQEVGTLVGGERARRILANLDGDLANVITDTGKPKARGALSEAIGQVERLESERAAAQRRLDELDHQLDELEGLRSERKKLSDPELTRQMMENLRAAQGALKEGEAAATALKQYMSEEQHAFAVLEQHQKKLEESIACAERIDRDRARCVEIQELLKPLDEQERQSRNAIADGSAEITRLDQATEQREQRERLLKRMSAIVSRLATRDGLVQRLNALQDFESRQNLNDAALKSNRVSEKVAATLDELERDLGNLTARLEAGAARIDVEIATSSEVPVTMDGTKLEIGTARAIVDPTTITVGDIARITVSPPAASRELATRQRSELADRLGKLFDTAGVSSNAELRHLRALRVSLELDARGLKAEKISLGLQDSDLPAETARIRAELEDLNASVERIKSDQSMTHIPSSSEIENQLNELTDLRHADRLARGGFDNTVEHHNRVIGEISSKRGELRGTLAEVERQLNLDLARLPDAERDRILTEFGEIFRRSQLEHGGKAALREQRQAKAPDAEELQRRESRVSRLTAALGNQKSSLEKLDIRIANLEGQIQIAGGDGLGELVLSLEEQCAIAARELDRQNHRVATLQLLRDTVDSCYRSRREQLNAPLRRHLQPFLSDVFPKAEIQLGDGFSVTGINRHGPGSEQFDHLSDGTQEQIAVLVRLAMGAMIAERGQEVPIVLDDALVFSDDDRIEKMFDALNRAGKHQQIIVLTCRTRTFAALGGRQLTISSGAEISPPNT